MKAPGFMRPARRCNTTDLALRLLALEAAAVLTMAAAEAAAMAACELLVGDRFLLGRQHAVKIAHGRRHRLHARDALLHALGRLRETLGRRQRLLRLAFRFHLLA